MARPEWEKVITYRLAVPLGLAGVPEGYALNVAALVTRLLDRKYGLSKALLSVSTEDVTGIDDHIPAPMKDFWTRLAGRDAKTEASRLLTMARYAMRHARKDDLVIARTVASDTLAARKSLGWSVIDKNWGVGGWDGLSGLREEIVTRGSASGVEFYDRYTGDPDLRAEGVKAFQTAAKNAGYYDKRVDGVWGDGSEAAWKTMSGSSGEHQTTYDEAQTVARAIEAFFGDFTTATAVAVSSAVARDEWLSFRGVPESPYPLPQDRPTAPPSVTISDIRYAGPMRTVTMDTSRIVLPTENDIQPDDVSTDDLAEEIFDSPDAAPLSTEESDRPKTGEPVSSSSPMLMLVGIVLGIGGLLYLASSGK